MASASFSMLRNGAAEGGTITVTEGVLAPGVGDIEVRVNVAQGWTKNEIEIAMDRIFRFICDATVSTSIPL